MFGSFLYLNILAITSKRHVDELLFISLREGKRENLYAIPQTSTWVELIKRMMPPTGKSKDLLSSLKKFHGNYLRC